MNLFLEYFASIHAIFISWISHYSILKHWNFHTTITFINMIECDELTLLILTTLQFSYFSGCSVMISACSAPYLLPAELRASCLLKLEINEDKAAIFFSQPNNQFRSIHGPLGSVWNPGWNPFKQQGGEWIRKQSARVTLSPQLWEVSTFLRGLDWCGRSHWSLISTLRAEGICRVSGSGVPFSAERMCKPWPQRIEERFLLISRRRQWHPTPVLLPGKSHGRRSLVGCSPWGCLESGTTERLGNPFQYSCLENRRDRGA